MNMIVVNALLLAGFAGILNGSFALPTKNIKKWNFENIWLQYSIWAFLILPWVVAYFISPNIFKVYEATHFHYIVFMVIGGLLFGIGQIGLAFAITTIGMGLSLVICIGLATGLGFFLPFITFHADKLLTLLGFLTILGTILAILGLIFSTMAGGMRRKNKQTMGKHQHSKHYNLGVFLAIIAGLFSAGENFTFALCVPMQKLASQMGVHALGAANIMWPGFLFFTFIPYAIYMIYLHNKKRALRLYKSTKTPLYFLLTIIMGAFWFSSLIFYSQSTQLIGSLGPVLAWPLFMAFIILMSNFWGWIYKEWKYCGKKAIRVLWLGLICLVASVIIFAISAHISY